MSVKSLNGKYQYYINDKSDITFGADASKRETGDGNNVVGTLQAQSNPKSVGVYSYGGYYNSDLLKGFVTYSNNIDSDSNFMLNVHKYQDDKKYKLANLKFDMNEIWNQNGAKSEYRTVFNSLALMGGIDIQRNTTDELKYLAANSSKQSDFATQEDVNALYTELKYQISSALTTTFNLRYDNIQQKYIDNTGTATNIAPSYNVASYRAGLNYKLPENHLLYANISTGFRTPTVAQTSQNQESLKVDPTLNIPSKIGVETTYNYEIGVRGKLSTLNYDASVYQLTRKNYIGAIAGSYIISDNLEESNYANVGDMRSRGFELAVGSNKKELLSFNLAYTYLDAVFTSYSISRQMTVDPDGPYRPKTATYERTDLSGNTVPRTSKHTVDLTVDYKPTSKITLTPELVVKSSYYADEVNANEQAGYEVVNLRAMYKYSDSLEFFAKIDNLLDEKYYQFVYLNSSAIATMEKDATIRVAPPTAYYASMRYKF